MNDHNFRLITKYALLLSVFFIFSYAFDTVIIELAPVFASRTHEVIYTSLVPLAFDLFLNLVTAYIVAQDIKKFNVKTKYVTLATIVYRPVGVFSFLLFLFFQERGRVEGEVKIP